MSLIIIIASVAFLVLLVSWLKVHPFPAFLLVSIIAAMLLGVPLNKIAGSIEKGIGDILSSLLILLVFGAMFGKVIASSGAAQKIAAVMMIAFGRKYIQWAMVLIGFVIGIPLFYGVGFVLMIPLIFSVVYKYKLPAVFIGLPMLAALSVTHGFLPPHPSPAALVIQFKANMGLTLLYGIAVAIPAIIIAGPIFSRFLTKIPAKPLASFVSEDIAEDKLPGTFNSFFAALLPVLMLTATALLANNIPASSPFSGVISFFASPSIVLITVFTYAVFSLGIFRGQNMQSIMDNCINSVKDIASILLIIAGSGALKQVLTDAGISQQIAQQFQSMPLSPLVLGWLIAAIIRACVGSATVAGLTTAGIVLPLIASTHTNPNLMVLAVGAGSLAFSHVNDSGFWMFKEYFSLSVKNTLLSWSIMESIVAVVGLIGVLILNVFIN